MLNVAIIHRAALPANLWYEHIGCYLSDSVRTDGHRLVDCYWEMVDGWRRHRRRKQRAATGIAGAMSRRHNVAIAVEGEPDSSRFPVAVH